MTGAAGGTVQDRKLFCLIKQTDVPESHPDAAKFLEKLVTYRCGCGWPDQPCLDMHADLRGVTFVTTTATLGTFIPGWQRPWNRAPRPR